MEYPSLFWGVIVWMIVWGVGGSIATRYRYLHKDLDTSNANFVGATDGGAPIDAGTETGRPIGCPNSLVTCCASLVTVTPSVVRLDSLASEESEWLAKGEP